MRLFTRRARLYSEMITADAVVHGDRHYLLAHDPLDGPVALQLGGSDPGQLALAAAIGADFGYDEINLNVGCPSDRVRSGRFGACLMAEPKLVASCVRAMKRSVRLPVTVKCRIGIDGQDPARVLPAFAARVAEAGADALIVHARKAWLEGLSPRENRELPPLDHALVHDLKVAMPDLPVVINGGIRTLGAARAHLAHVDGVMLGRSAYQTPELLGSVDRDIFGERDGACETGDVVRRYLDHVSRECAAGTPLAAMTRHMLGLFHGAPGARAWRRHLSQHCRRTDAGPRVIFEALDLVRCALDAAAEAA
jgi:tRNA-dihydrouridine synthase A